MQWFLLKVQLHELICMITQNSTEVLPELYSLYIECSAIELFQDSKEY